jgi:hypothetical protein
MRTYNRDMRFRNLRIAWSVLWSVLCVLLIALWIRSHTYGDRAEKTTNGGMNISVGTAYGTLVVIRSTDPSFFTDPTDWEIEHRVLNGEKAMEPPWLPFYTANNVQSILIIPLWVFAVVFSACGAAPWVRHLRRQFSRHTLLIATQISTRCRSSNTSITKPIRCRNHFPSLARLGLSLTPPTQRPIVCLDTCTPPLGGGQ